MPSAQITPDQDAIVAEIEIAAPPQRVFQALTDPKQLIRWWGLEGPIKTTLWEMDAPVGGGGALRTMTPPGNLPSMAFPTSRPTARSSNSIRHACWSIPGSQTGTYSPTAGQ